jgi:hypothetical protein
VSSELFMKMTHGVSREKEKEDVEKYARREGQRK